MDFLQDYWTYHRSYEIPRSYALWSALALLGATINRKVHFLHGDIEIHANIYVLLVGPVGNGKTTSCDFASQLFQKACPDLEIGASTQSAEDIVIEMAKDTFARVYTNELDEQIEIRPYAFFINEFKDFIAYSPVRMLNFLGNIYDRKRFKAGTVKRGIEDIINPSLNILGCENPDQLSKLMKNDVITGGMSRRMILVYEIFYQEPVAFIEISPEARAAWQRVEDRLIACRKVVGRYQWAESGKKLYKPWYEQTKRSLAKITNVVMQGYTSTKHIQLFKICMLLDACSDKPMLLFTDELLQSGLALLDSIETNMPRLSITAGRNEMMGPQQKILDLLENAGGWLPEKRLMRDIESELTPMERMSVIRHLIDSDQIIKRPFEVPNAEGTKITREMLLLPWKYAELTQKGDIELVKKRSPIQ